VNVLLLWTQLIPTVRQFLRKAPVDLIDAHFGYPDGIAAALLASLFKLPFSITLRGNETMHAKHRIRGWLLSWMLRRANLVVTVSSRLKEFALSCGAAPDRVLNIPNGIDNTVFYRRDRTAMKAKLGIPGNRQIVLSAGSLIERKGHHRVASEIAGFVRAGHPVHLIIAGGPGREGAFETKLRAEIQSAGLQNNVTFTGHVDPTTLAELMSAADVFCLASSREGWPNVVHEALACGTPVVATDVGAVPEMLPAQDFGFVVPLGDQQALGKALETALNHNWNRSKIAAYGQSRSWQQVAHEVLQAMHQVVKDREAK
jgi:glycosyltransferase involved in cell wall biosynthesis